MQLYTSGSTQLSQSSPMVSGVRFSGPVTTDSLRLENPSNSTINEVRVAGSQITDQAPTVRILWPADGEVVSLSDWDHRELIGFIDNPEAVVKVNGATVYQNGHYFRIDLPDLKVQLWQTSKVSAVATDPQGRVSNQTIEFMYGELPVINLDQADQLSYTDQSSAVISGNVLVTCSQVSVNGKSYPVSNHKFSVAVPLEEGFNPINVTCNFTGSDGKKQFMDTVEREVVRCSQPLNITIDSPQADAYVNSGGVVVSGTVTGLGPIAVTVNGCKAKMDGMAFRADGVSLLEGKNTLTVKATDAKGRSFQKTLTVIRDTKAPVLSGITPSNGYITNSGAIKVTGKVSDSNTCWVYVNGKLTTVSNGTFNTNVTLTQEGNQQIIVKATDIADNSASVTINVTVDLSPPLVFTPVANPADWASNNRPVISFGTSDIITGIDHYELAVDSQAFTKVSSPYKLPVTADGEHLITVKAFDKVGWVTVGTTKVYIDTTAPVITDFKAVPGNQKVIVSWKTGDTDVKTYTLKRVPAFKDGSKKVFGPDILQYTDTDVVNLSTYTYSIQAIDHVGNVNQYITAPTVKPGLAEVSASPKTDTKVEYENVTIGVPVGALSTTKTLTVTTVKDADPIVAKSLAVNVSPVYSFGASTTQGPVDPAGVQFNKPVLVGIHYTLDQNSVLKYLNKSNLRAYYYNYKDNNWEMIPESFVDPNSDTVYFFTNHFSMFSVQASVGPALSPEQVSNMGVSPGKAYFQNNQVNISYAGGTSAVMAKDFVLPGRGGLDLSISRTYDSGTGQSDWGVDEKNIFSTVFGFIEANEWLTIAKEFIARALDNYLSQPAGAYGFGRGWRINFVWVEKNENGQFVHLPGGGMKKINWSMDGSGWGGQGHGIFECHAGEHFILEQHQTKVSDLYSDASNGNQAVKIGENWNTTDYLLTTKEGTQYYMNGSGKLLRIVNRLGTSEINLSYRGDGKLSYIIDSVGRKINFTYNGNFIDSISGGGKTVSYSYDNNELVAVNDAGLQTTKYNYEKHSLTTSTQTISALSIVETICQFANPAAWVALIVGMLPNERSDDVYYLSNVYTPFQGEYRITYQEFTGYRYITDSLGLSCTFMYYQTSKVTRFQEIGSSYSKDIAIRYQIDYPNDKPPMIGTCDFYEGTPDQYTKHTYMSFARYSNGIDDDSSYLKYQEERDQNEKMLTAHTVDTYDTNLEAPTQVIDQTGGQKYHSRFSI